jgi:hypothetical protein
MLDHDTSVMDQLDGEDPLSAEDLQELECLANEHEATAQLATTSDDPSLTQMIGSPSFWQSVDFSTLGISGGTPEPSAGNPSGS